MRFLASLLVAGLLAVTGAALGQRAEAANPYDPVLVINGRVVTNYDVSQRVKLLEALGAGGDLQTMAVQQLTEDRLKLQAGKDLGIELPEGAIPAGVEEFASGRGLTMEDVNLALTARNIDRQTLDDFVEAGLMWREVMSARFRAKAMPTDADIDAAIQRMRTQPVEMMNLAEIALPFAERGEAETQKFADDLYRQLRAGANFADMARTYSRSPTAEAGGVLEPIPATRLPPTFRTEVLLLRPGQTTRPIPISGGLALIKLLSIKSTPPDTQGLDDPAIRDQLRQQLFSERITSFGQGYLQELQSDAVIVKR